jgi:hypothetical protein
LAYSVLLMFDWEFLRISIFDGLVAVPEAGGDAVARVTLVLLFSYEAFCLSLDGSPRGVISLGESMLCTWGLCA